MANHVFIAVSLDGFIADRHGGLDWLHAVPNPEGLDFGYAAFLSTVDAIVMGRRTFETVRGFGGDWPYTKPVWVLSRSLAALPGDLAGQVELAQGRPMDVVAELRSRGCADLYVDGGATIQAFLQADLVDEMTITVLPVLLGGGVRLFGELPAPLGFEHRETNVFLQAMVQSRYRRNRERIQGGRAL